jgi:hypothetical protein
MSPFLEGANRDRPSLSSGRGNLVLETSLDGLLAFRVGCAVGGNECLPTWTGVPSQSISAAELMIGSVSHRLVLTTLESEMGADSVIPEVDAFRLACHMQCQPVWFDTTKSSHAGAYDAFLTTPVVRAQRMFITSGTSLYVYGLHCSASERRREPIRRVRLRGGFLRTPVIGEDRIYISAFDGHLYALPIRCGGPRGSCGPLWTFNAGHEAVNGPVAGRGVVLLAAGRYLYALRSNCARGGRPCRPDWRWRAPAAISNTPVVRGNTLIVTAGSDLYALRIPRRRG